MGPSVERVLVVCLKGFALLNKMAVMPIYKTKRKKKKKKKKKQTTTTTKKTHTHTHLKVFFTRGKKTLRPSLGIVHVFGDSRSTEFVQMMILG